jgi:hypothetical protein
LLKVFPFARKFFFRIDKPARRKPHANSNR